MKNTKKLLNGLVRKAIGNYRYHDGCKRKKSLNKILYFYYLYIVI